MTEWIYGRNPVYETLLANRRHVHQLIVSQRAKAKNRLAEIINICEDRRIQLEWVPRQRLDSLSSGHQGVALKASGYPYKAPQDILSYAEKQDEPPFLLILDTLQDPQNLGALLRTAEIVGVHGVFIPLRHSVKITPAVVNSSSGASEHILITQVNLAQTITRLKKANIWVIGLEGNPEAQYPNQIRLDGPVALVVGNEANGMRPLVRKSCDLLMQLPMRGQIGSLNAAVAGSVALYLVWQTRNFK
jgi:23S rRNA (guanosine2251-2'-O)-methyltransferase